MNYEKNAPNEQPHNKRIFQARSEYLSAINQGIPMDLSAQSAARWNSIGVEYDKIDQTTWNQLRTYANLDQDYPASHQQVMQRAIQKNLAEKLSPEQPSEDDRVSTDQLFQLPEFQPDAIPYADLKTLYTDYSTIAHNHGVDNASMKWLFTRSIHPHLLQDLHKYRKPIQQEQSFYQQASELFSNQYKAQTEKNKKPIVHASLASMQNAYTTFIEEHNLDQPSPESQQAIANWVSAQRIELSDDDKRELADINIAMRRNTPPEAELAMKLQVYLGNKRGEQQRKQEQTRIDALATQRERIQAAPPTPAEQPAVDRHHYIQALFPKIEELTEGVDPNDVDTLTEIYKKIGAEAWPNLPDNLKRYYEDRASRSGNDMTGPMSFVTSLMVKSPLRKRKPKKKSPFWKRWFGYN